MSDIEQIERKKKIKKRTVEFRNDITKYFTDNILPSYEDLTRIQYDANGNPYLNLSDAKVKIIFDIGAMSSGKSKMIDYFVVKSHQKYGKENVNFKISRNITDLIGVYNQDTGEFSQNAVDEKLVQFFVLEDALTSLSKKISGATITAFNEVFHNVRHLMKYRDEYGNKKGLFLLFVNAQDWYTLHEDIRKNFSAIIYKTSVKNEENNQKINARLPLEAVKILENNTIKLFEDDPEDQAWKSTSIVDLGYGKFGILRTPMVTESFCYDKSPYWAKKLYNGAKPLNSTDNTNNSSNSNSKPIMSGEFLFKLIKQQDFPNSLLEAAFLYGKQNPYPIGERSKYKPDKHWQPVYEYFVENKAAGDITGPMGLKGDTMLTNGYKDGGYVAIIVREQLGHWIEPMIPKFITEIKWMNVADQGTSDLKDPVALRGNLGEGYHGEVKTRRKKETPNASWLSTEMTEHIQRGGKGKLYQLVVRRILEETSSILYTYDIELNNTETQET